MAEGLKIPKIAWKCERKKWYFAPAGKGCCRQAQTQAKDISQEARHRRSRKEEGTTSGGDLVVGGGG